MISIIRVTKKFVSILSEHQGKRVIIIVFLMIIGGLLEMCSVSLVIPFMNAVMNDDKIMEKWYAKLICSIFHINSAREFLVIVAIIMACIYVIKNIYLLLEYNIQYRFVYNNMFTMQSRVLDNYLHKPYEYFLMAESGEIIRILNNDISMSFALLSSLLGLFAETVVSIMLILTIFFITPFATICMTVALILLLCIINVFIKPVLRRAGETNQLATAGMNKWILQSINGIKEIKISKKEAYFHDCFDKNGKIFVNAIRKNQLLNITPRFLMEAASMGTIFLVVAYMIYNGSKLGVVAPMLSAVAMAAIRLLPSVNRISGGIASVAYSEPMLDKLLETLEGIEVNYDSVSKSEKMRNELSLKNILDFKNVTYRYPEADSDVLNDATMHVRCGESVGIVGSSGAGKTTVIDIILGLLKPKQGEILVDGIDISNYIDNWYEQIGYIPQSIFMLDGSIRENVALGEENVSEELIWEVLEEASLFEFVKSLPNGINTQIGERGIRLSGGQRQRIGIARALYKNPSVLIFDEATSALDNETEASIMESIRSLHGKKTMIIIAHRLTTIESCDSIFRVENGKIKKVR